MHCHLWNDDEEDVDDDEEDEEEEEEGAWFDKVDGPRRPIHLRGGGNPLFCGILVLSRPSCRVSSSSWTPHPSEPFGTLPTLASQGPVRPAMRPKEPTGCCRVIP